MERKAGKWVIKSQQMEKDSRLLTMSEVVRTESAHTFVLLFCLATAVWHLAESNGKNGKFTGDAWCILGNRMASILDNCSVILKIKI